VRDKSSVVLGIIVLPIMRNFGWMKLERQVACMVIGHNIQQK